MKPIQSFDVKRGCYERKKRLVNMLTQTRKNSFMASTGSAKTKREIQSFYDSKIVKVVTAFFMLMMHFEPISFGIA